MYDLWESMEGELRVDIRVEEYKIREEVTGRLFHGLVVCNSARRTGELDYSCSL